MTFCILRRRTIVKISLDGVRAFSVVLFPASVSPSILPLSFRRSVLGSTTAVFLDHVSRDWGDVTVVLVDLRWTPRRLHISSTAAKDYSYFQWAVQLGHCFGRCFAKFDDLGVCSCRRSSLSILCWTCWSSPSVFSPERKIPYACGSQTSR